MKPFLHVVIWQFNDGFGVGAFSRGPTIQQIGDRYPDRKSAEEADRFVPRRRQAIGFKDMRVREP